jgi:hypothetical protein
LLDIDVNRIIHGGSYLSVKLKNVLGAGWMVGGDPLERMLEADLNYLANRRVMFRGGIGVSDHYPADYRGMVAWQPHDAIAINMGVGTVPSRVEMGIRVDRGGWLSGINMAKVTNEAIGWRQSYWLGRVVS